VLGGEEFVVLDSMLMVVGLVVLVAGASDWVVVVADFVLEFAVGASEWEVVGAVLGFVLAAEELEWIVVRVAVMVVPLYYSQEIVVLMQMQMLEPMLKQTVLNLMFGLMQVLNLKPVVIVAGILNWQQHHCCQFVALVVKIHNDPQMLY